MDKSKYQEVGGGMNVDRMWSGKENPLKKGDAIEGRYIEKKVGIGTRGSNVYVIETQSGEKVGVWGSTVIDGRFESIPVGKMVGIEYLGVQKTKDGKGEYKGFFIGIGNDYVGDEGGEHPIRTKKKDEEDIGISEEDFPF